MTTLNAAHWSKRYRDGEIGWDIGSISTPLKEYFLQLKNKQLKILIPGAGNGYEAAFLHKNGFENVWIVDWAEKPIQDFLQRNPTFPKERCICSDFFKIEGDFDLIVEQTFFCALPTDFRKKYVEKMNSLLNEKGKLVGLFFNRNFGNDFPPFGGNREEYQSLFSSFFEIKTLEKCYNSIMPRKDAELFFIFEKKS